MNEIFSEICREENQELHEAALKRYVRARRLRAAGEVLGCAICVASIYAFTVLMFCM